MTRLLTVVEFVTSASLLHWNVPLCVCVNSGSTLTLSHNRSVKCHALLTATHKHTHTLCHLPSIIAPFAYCDTVGSCVSVDCRHIVTVSATLMQQLTASDW